MIITTSRLFSQTRHLLLTPTALSRRKIMDVHIPPKLVVTTHNQYKTPDHLTVDNVRPQPLDQFKDWFEAARTTVAEPEAMTLSTSTPSGIPSARVVLLKLVDDKGFIFFTNYTSRKSKELLENPNAALTFYWKEVSRQIRVVGKVEKVTRQESEEYFQSRPLGSRIGAWASKQSSVVEEGEVQERYAKLEKRFGEESVPTPEFWGGWRLIPNEVEFWLGKPSRLHDRVQYTRQNAPDSETPSWTIRRLAP
ncbi:pyridoxamine 5'-phosphate oxidase [Sistotremastrum suecicum HHB10207 ss-3]|uniref:pyridoxal 5'-phosphate synthase n=1 Tax=Sistotremastrum suecicum HHB10207 ss-3 TaxID=1314776 RepID=A0A166II63_9AGAM|nr:pyridoxamine 5'-phosphate oxidase [Sistotremastrum suecicum HHB10207 ss-3]